MCDTFCRRNQAVGHMSKNQAVKYVNESFSIEQKRPQGVEGVQEIEVVSEGSKVMKMMKLPSVFIRVPKGHLQKSRVYYVLLQSESYELGAIPAVMLSNPYDDWKTQTAELLPLLPKPNLMWARTISLTPMLCESRYKRMFCKGSSFKVQAIKGGRFERCGKIPWNRWNLKLDAIRIMLTDSIYRDIRGMPSDMVKRLIPVSTSNIISRNSSNSSQSSSKQSSSKKSARSTSQQSSSRGSHSRNLSAHYPNLKFKGLTASGGSSFAKWFRQLPADMYVDKNFKCDRGTILRKDRFADPENFFNYLSK